MKYNNYSFLKLVTEIQFPFKPGLFCGVGREAKDLLLHSNENATRLRNVRNKSNRGPLDLH